MYNLWYTVSADFNQWLFDLHLIIANSFTRFEKTVGGLDD